MKTYYVRFGSGDPRLTAGLAPTFLIFNNYGTGVTPPGVTSVIGATGFYAFQYGTTTPIVFLIDGATTGLSDAQRYVSGSIDPVDRMDEVGTTLVAIGTTNFALGTTSVALGTTSVALGITMVAIGTSHIAQGVTSIALGTSAVASGITAVALGNTLLSYGLTTAALGNTAVSLGITSVALGTSIFALGTTGVALGTTNLSQLINQGVTIVGIGNTLQAIGNTTISFVSGIGSTASSFGTNLADPVDLFGYMKRVIEDLEGNESFTKISGALSIYSRGSSQLLITKTITNSVSMVIKT